ncbi:unnamed protein product [Thlaspi arvense]|uniref:BZIP domain-containing protein n=1 Tax=Thlaspi arvense TaxID=13288 RepID=A0AAU9RUS5_THLAR|nr:unnamed protein product [Thlaspi arvense]
MRGSFGSSPSPLVFCLAYIPIIPKTGSILNRISLQQIAMFSTSFEPVHICFDDATITGDEITEILAFLQSSNSDNPSGSNELVEPFDEKKRRRTMSNRESAKRSRLRKKRRFEDLTEEVNRLNLKNQELKKQLANVLSSGNFLSRENNRLKTESVCLEIRLLELYRFLVAMQSPFSTRLSYIELEI